MPKRVGYGRKFPALKKLKSKVKKAKGGFGAFIGQKKKK